MINGSGRTLKRRRKGSPIPNAATGQPIGAGGQRLGRSQTAVTGTRRILLWSRFWLALPEQDAFPPQVDGDLEKDGVCGLYIAGKLCVSQPTASEQPRILVAAGPIRGTRIKSWTFYKRNERRIADVKRAFRKAW
jgi:hypothetical protein